MNYNPASSGIRAGLDKKINEDKKKIIQNTEHLKADLKTTEDISKSFDEIISLFYEINKHKKEKKQMGQFKSGTKFDSSSTVSSIKGNFFVSKIDSGANDFTRDLAAVINEFFKEFLKAGVGLLPLIDAFIEFNKHRGVDIVSSKDFKTSCQILNQNTSK